MQAIGLDTPCLLLDIDAVEANIARMAEFLRDKPAALRPHFKTPKNPRIARMQLDAGAIGITVAKLGEAEVLADAEVGPILMANQVVGAVKIDRLMALLGRGVDIIVAVESEFNITQLVEGAERSGQTPAAIIEIDSGMHRCGTSIPAETVALARSLIDSGIRYRGVMGYEGHAVLNPDLEERTAKATAALTIVKDHVEALAEAGMAPEIVSVGGTGTHQISSQFEGVTEIQAGSYVFMDGAYQRVLPGMYDSALTLLTTVLSVRDDYAVCDAGMKSLTNEFGAPRTKDGSLKVRGLSEEHAFLVGDGLAALSPGDKVELVPSHGDTTLNLHSAYHIVRNGEEIDEWPIVAARKYK